MFWKKNSKGANKEQRPNTDKANSRVLGERDGVVVVEVTYPRECNTSRPKKHRGDYEVPQTFWEFMHWGKPSGWGKVALLDAHMEELPSISTEEQAELEAEKREKARLHEESAKLSGIPITREDIDAYLKSRWSQGDHLVYNLNHRGDKGAEDTVSVWVHCDPTKRFEKVEFTEALEATNPGLFHDVFIDDEDGYWGRDDTLIKFRGSSGTNFTVSCYKIRRGDFYVYMHAGLHAGEEPITVGNVKELEAVVETFRYLNSMPTTPPRNQITTVTKR